MHFSCHLLTESNTSFIIMASSGARDTRSFYFSIWRMAAILDLEVKVISNLVHTHCNGFVMQELVGNDILFVLLAPLLPEI